MKALELENLPSDKFKNQSSKYLEVFRKMLKRIRRESSSDNSGQASELTSKPRSTSNIVESDQTTIVSPRQRSESSRAATTSPIQPSSKLTATSAERIEADAASQATGASGPTARSDVAVQEGTSEVSRPVLVQSQSSETSSTGP